LDMGGDEHDVQKLVFGDIDNHARGAKLRDDILALLEEQARWVHLLKEHAGDKHDKKHDKLDSAAVASSSSGSVTSSAATSAEPEIRVLRVLSDVDDTFCPGFADQRYGKIKVVANTVRKPGAHSPWHRPYPGVREFYKALLHGPAVEDISPELGHPADPNCHNLSALGFLTARLQVPGSEKAQLKQFAQHHGLEEKHFRTFMLSARANTNPLAPRAEKEHNFVTYRRCFQECSFVWIGDNGQADEEVGMSMMEHASSSIKAAFIHIVVDKELKFKKDSRFVYFDTYVGAGTEAFRRKLISAGALRHIVKSAETDEMFKLAQGTFMDRFFVRDLEVANAVLTGQSE